MIKPKHYKFISILLKTVIVTGAFLFIYKRVNQQEQQFLDFFNKVNINAYNLSLSGFTILLMLFNWWLESLKWKILVKRIEPVSTIKSLKSVLAGITISVFTPNRVGEVGGRIFYLKKADHITAAFLSFAGSFIQLLCTLVFGFIAFFFLYLENESVRSIVSVNSFFIWSLIGVTGLIGIFLWIVLNKPSIEIQNKLNEVVGVFKSFPPSDLYWVGIYSITRYLIFTLQFYLLLIFFNVHIDFFIAVASIGLTFLFISAIPTFFLTELGVRGAVSISIIGLFSSNSEGILLASAFIWVINIAFPAVIGAIFVFNLKFFRRKEE